MTGAVKGGVFRRMRRDGEGPSTLSGPRIVLANEDARCALAARRGVLMAPADIEERADYAILAVLGDLSLIPTQPHARRNTKRCISSRRIPRRWKRAVGGAERVLVVDARCDDGGHSRAPFAQHLERHPRRFRSAISANIYSHVFLRRSAAGPLRRTRGSRRRLRWDEWRVRREGPVRSPVLVG